MSRNGRWYEYSIGQYEDIIQVLARSGIDSIYHCGDYKYYYAEHESYAVQVGDCVMICRATSPEKAIEKIKSCLKETETKQAGELRKEEEI